MALVLIVNIDLKGYGNNDNRDSPKEIKTDEFRVGATPINVSSLIEDGHKVFVQSCAGVGSGFSAAKIAFGMGADVTVVNRSTPKLLLVFSISALSMLMFLKVFLLIVLL